MVDCVICYKLDRLTRSLLYFARTLEILEQRNVALVSVTQAFDTSTALEIVTFQSEDHAEALLALREKRKPAFRGR